MSATWYLPGCRYVVDASAADIAAGRWHRTVFPRVRRWQRWRCSHHDSHLSTSWLQLPTLAPLRYDTVRSKRFLL